MTPQASGPTQRIQSRVICAPIADCCMSSPRGVVLFRLYPQASGPTAQVVCGWFEPHALCRKHMHTTVNSQPTGRPALDRTRTARAERRAAVRADRARGFTMRQLAQRHGISVGLAHLLACDVQVMLPNRWHCARLPRDVALPVPVHHLLVRKA